MQDTNRDSPVGEIEDEEDRPFETALKNQIDEIEMKKVEPKPSSPERYQKLSMLMADDEIPSKIHHKIDDGVSKFSESNKEIDYKISMLSLPQQPQASATDYQLSESEAN